MGSLGLESVLIGSPGDGDGRSIGLLVRVRSPGNGAGFIAGDLLLGSGFFHLDAVFRLVTVPSKRSTLSSFCCFFYYK